MTRLGVYGGAFDPIHAGHVAPVLEALTALALDRVLYLPTGRPPHKPGPVAPALRRWAMVELALLPHAQLHASPLELADDRPSYTVDSLARLALLHPGATLVLLVGADAFAELDAWRDWPRILELAEVGVLTRPGTDWEALVAGLRPELRAALAAGRARRVANRPVAASSTELRRRLAAGEPPPPGSLPALVLDYARKYDLYRAVPPETSADAASE